jgi:predicted subunit of tRNA(5-methylaminomethyl-2-thiouridylate) methyltransferase
MPNKDEIKKYIDDFREDNKNKVLQKYQNKSIDEKKNIKDLKKFGLNIDKLSDFDENEIFKNKEKTEEEKDADAENEFSMQGEDDDNDHDIEFNNLDYYDFGFIYSKS